MREVIVSPTKDATIKRLVRQVASRLPRGSFMVRDYWEADACAVGLASVAEPGRLVYVCTFGCRPGRCNADLEYPPRPNSKLPYRQGSHHQEVGLTELVSIIRKHLARPRAARGPVPAALRPNKRMQLTRSAMANGRRGPRS